jgi:hypothetical protein
VGDRGMYASAAFYFEAALGFCESSRSAIGLDLFCFASKYRAEAADP